MHNHSGYEGPPFLHTKSGQVCRCGNASPCGASLHKVELGGLFLAVDTGFQSLCQVHFIRDVYLLSAIGISVRIPTSILIAYAWQ